EVLPVDLPGGLESGPRGTEGVLVDPEELRGELDLLGHALQAEVADEAEGAGVVAVGAEAGGDEGHLRVFVDLEEVARPQVVVPLLVTGVDRGHLDRRGRPRRRHILGDLHGALELPKHSAHFGHKVTYRETDLGVNGVDRPHTREKAWNGG